MPDHPDTDRWYWDRRTQDALYPLQIDDDTVRFVTVRHPEEVDDALETGALVPFDDDGLERTETMLDFMDSFRMPDDIADTSADTSGSEGGD